MENLDRYKKIIKQIESLIIQMENGSLNIQELSKLELLTGELHERSIILKYKAFENHVNETHHDSVFDTKGMEMDEKIEIVEDRIEDLEEAMPDLDLTLDFSVFDQHEEEKEEPVKTKPEMVFETQPQVEVTNSEPEAKTEKNDISFWEQLNISNNSLSSQFEGAKLDTLVGVFGLNEKLRYINELFDGSSELFSEAVKLLDSQSSIDEAKVKSSELAAKYSWDAEEDAVVDFMTMVNRRYA